MATVTVYGASDDLIEIEGDLSEEFSASRDEKGRLVFGDGTVLKVAYDDFGIWRITRELAGSAHYVRDEDPGNDEDRYSDRVKLDGDLGWVAWAADLQLHKIADPAQSVTPA